MKNFEIKSDEETMGETVISEFENRLDNHFNSLLKSSDVELANPHCNFEKVLSFINSAIAETDPQLLTDVQKKSILNILSITDEQAKEKYDLKDPISYCLIKSEIDKLHDEIVEVNEEEYEKARARKATITDGNEAFKSMLNCVRRKTFTTREALDALLKLDQGNN